MAWWSQSAAMARTLSGMAVCITGGSSGIGAALARELVTAGARVAIMARRRERLEALIAELGPQHIAVVGDVAVAADCQRAITTAAHTFNRLDTVVCNAGVGLFRTLEETSRADWDAILATNVHGTLDCIRAAVPIMRAQEPVAGWRGQVMIVSSILARRAAPRCAAYCATKAAQLSIAEALRGELRADHIAVTSVHPIGTRTEFFASAGAAEERGSAFDQTPEHVARRMQAAIRRPRPEVWPSRPSRWLTSLGTLVPGLFDRVVERLAPK